MFLEKDRHPTQRQAKSPGEDGVGGTTHAPGASGLEKAPRDEWLQSKNIEVLPSQGQA